MTFSQGFRATVSTRVFSDLIREVSVEQEKSVEIQVKPSLVKNGFGSSWFMGNEKFAEKIVFDPFFDVRTRLLFAFMLLTEWSSKEALVVNSELAKELKIHPVTVSDCVKQLIKKGILVRGDKVQKSYYYRINPHIVWKGSGKDHREALAETKKPVYLEKTLKRLKRHPTRRFLAVVNSRET